MIIHGDVEAELVRVWDLIGQLSDQLQENRGVTADLRAQADALKAKAMHSGTGYPLRRFNIGLSKETFEEELEKLNTQFSSENQALSNDNKQLSVLVKEYEQTLESVMGKFRLHAHTTQEHELLLTRQYEEQLFARESTRMSHDLEESARISISISNLSEWLRLALRASNGESAQLDIDYGTDSQEPSSDVIALERECELVRLEKENEELRSLLELRDEKDMASLREEIAQETREAYLRRTGGQLESPFLSHAHNVDSDPRGPRMFSPGGFRGLNRGKRGGMVGRGKQRPFGSHQGW
ncbi:hypothetical protein FRC19_009404 [Serendipita sp. 401]|nr:hypothetical protein FRC19_009404 [Serendipita sp. 401]KAG9055973.1 hypothetical protein FS842_000648 [Serendipita sp. 407]